MKKEAAKSLAEDISAIVQAFADVCERSCAAIKPIVDDACRYPASVDEDELAHIFDWVLDVACCSKGRRMFTRLCKAFSSIYPDCVRDYIKIDQDQNGEDLSDEKPSGAKTQCAHSHFSTKLRIGAAPCRAPSWMRDGGIA